MDHLLAWSRAVLTTTPTRWTNLTETIPDDLVRCRAAPSEWSAMECLQHLVDTECHVFPTRVRAILAGQDIAAYDPDRQGTKPPAAQSAAKLAREFADLRAKSVKLLSQVAPSDLSRQARHEELGLVSLGELLNHWAGHDLMHTVQAERAMMQPFIHGCGPWQANFRDHLIEQST